MHRYFLLLNRSVLILALMVVALSFASPSAFAQTEMRANPDTSLVLWNIQHVDSRIQLDRNAKVDPPIEPYFKQIKFLRIDPPRTLTERVDALIYGIKTDIPPEYDHYGYEIRRYMKSILTPDDLMNTLLLPEKIQNAETARIIMDYWKKSLLAEIKAIEEEIEKTNATSTIRTTFRYNTGIVHNFITDAYQWIDRNIEFLKLLQDNTGQYFITYPYYDAGNSALRQKIKADYIEREEALERIIVYSPFRAMIY